MDPLIKLAQGRAMLLRTRELSADIEVQLLPTVQGGRPVLEILRRLRDEAAEAMVVLVTVDAEKTSAVRDLQRKVLMFDDFIRITKEVIFEGIEADKLISESEIEEFRDQLLETEDGEETATELGLIEREPTDA